MVCSASPEQWHTSLNASCMLWCVNKENMRAWSVFLCTLCEAFTHKADESTPMSLLAIAACSSDYWGPKIQEWVGMATEIKMTAPKILDALDKLGAGVLEGEEMFQYISKLAEDVPYWIAKLNRRWLSTLLEKLGLVTQQRCLEATQTFLDSGDVTRDSLEFYVNGKCVASLVAKLVLESTMLVRMVAALDERIRDLDLQATKNSLLSVMMAWDIDDEALWHTFTSVWDASHEVSHQTYEAFAN